MYMKKLIVSALIALTAMCANAQEGAWSGELDIQGTKLPLVFHFDADGCTMDSPLQGAKGIKAEKSYTPEGKLKIVVPSIGASFEGVVVMKMITGNFYQGGLSLPLILKEGEPQVKRPQTPKGPFPYKTEEVSFKNGEFTFNGTLTLPQGCTKDTPVLVMVTGSGMQNRDEEMLDHKPFAVIADALAREGIATMRFDDRGYGVNGFKSLNYTIDDHKTDAEEGVKMLRSRFKNVGVLGHSEGGTIALMLASEGKADFAVSLAGMVVSGRETLLAQNLNTLKQAGLPQEQMDALYGAVQMLFDQTIEGKSIANIVNQDNVPDNLKPVIQQAVAQMDNPYMRHFLTVNVSKSLQNIKCPVLALNGKNDTQVDCESNINVLEKGLTNCKHKVVAYDSLNHLFQHCKTGQLAEYHQIEETISTDVLKDIIDWVKDLK